MDIFNAVFTISTTGREMDLERLGEIIDKLNEQFPGTFEVSGGLEPQQADLYIDGLMDTSTEWHTERLQAVVKAITPEGWFLTGKWTEDSDGEFFRVELLSDGKLRWIRCSWLLEMTVSEIADYAGILKLPDYIREENLFPPDKEDPTSVKYQMIYTKEDAGDLHVQVRKAPTQAEITARNRDVNAWARKEFDNCFLGLGVIYHEDLLTKKYTGIYRMRDDFRYTSGTVDELVALCLSFANSADVYRVATGNLMAKALIDGIGQDRLSPGDLGELTAIASGNHE